MINNLSELAQNDDNQPEIDPNMKIEKPAVRTPDVDKHIEVPVAANRLDAEGNMISREEWLELNGHKETITKQIVQAAELQEARDTNLNYYESLISGEDLIGDPTDTDLLKSNSHDVKKFVLPESIIPPPPVNPPPLMNVPKLQVSVKVDPSVHERIKQAAKLNGMTNSEIYQAGAIMFLENLKP